LKRSPIVPIAGSMTEEQTMTSNQAIIESIQDANGQVQRTIATLSAEQLQQPMGADRWTPCEVLAHMAGRKPAYERLIQAGTSNSPFGSGNVDPDEHNRSLVDARSGMSLDEVMQEFLAVHEWVIEQIRETPDQMLASVIKLPWGDMEYGELMRLAAGAHSVNHMQEIRQALDLDAEDA